MCVGPDLDLRIPESREHGGDNVISLTMALYCEHRDGSNCVDTK